MAAAISILPETKLIHLNDDCLEYIFNYLDLIDLINIVETNKRFSLAASKSFWVKYKLKWAPEMDEVDHEKLLRNFGNVIANLKIRG